MQKSRWLIFIIGVVLLASCGGSTEGLDSSNNSLNDNNLYFSIAAVNSSGIKSGLSNIAIKPITNGLSTVTLRWTAPTENVDETAYIDPAGYVIYYGRSSDPTVNFIEISNPSLSTYTIDNLDIL